MALPLIFDFYNSIIEVPDPDISLDMQYLINEIRDTEDELVPGVGYPKIAEASGKDDLGGSVSTAITVRLLDNWQIKFEDRLGPETIQCTIGGGNLVGGPGGNPIAASDFTQVVKLSSAAGTISTPTTSSENVNIKYMLASMGGTQKAVGSIFYWDPVSGNDNNTGLTPETAVFTFSKAHTLATSGHHDIIFALSSDPTGITTVTETISIIKDNVKLKGPGYSLQLIPTTYTADTIAVSADNVEISGFYISTDDEGSQDAISLSGDYSIIKDCWITNSQGKGIDISSSIDPVITNCVIENSADNGINLGSLTSRAYISKCIIYNNTNGIRLTGSSIADNTVEDCLIYKNSVYGLSVASGVARTTVRGGNTIVNNVTGQTLDLGTDTYIETPAGGASSSEIADAVWDEVLATHTGAGSGAKILKDAKLKATLASLKS